ncbi:hypothetical protein [Chitinophaga vietnamensis]|uniref:hypothetical protein n=1 Tax=Chitinophaga vietnamensis TaxID=2593957 RepID=UPI0011778CC9|nr:hypothetical protein [Chitinophaga vietnamensis]
MLLKTCLTGCLVFTVLVFASCKKKNRKDDLGSTQEEALKFDFAGVEEGAYNKALDSTFTFQVHITSKVPTAGVGTTLNVVSDPAGFGLDQAAVPNDTAATFSISLNHLKELKTYKVTVQLRSLGNTSNVSLPKIFYITNKVTP